MFFNLEDCKSGRVTSISINLSNMDNDLKNYLITAFDKNDTKIYNGKIVKKVNLSVDDIKILNDGFYQFIAQFIDDNLNSNKLKCKETVLENDIKYNISPTELENIIEENFVGKEFTIRDIAKRFDNLNRHNLDAVFCICMKKNSHKYIKIGNSGKAFIYKIKEE